VWPNNKAMQGFVDESERVLGIDPAEVTLPNRFSTVASFLLLKVDGTLLVHIGYVFGDLFELQTFHLSVFSLGFVAAHEVGIEHLGVLVV